MKPNLIKIFKDFLAIGKLPKGINSSFLVLVLRVSGSRTLSNLRPISLINGIFKMVSKVLSFRLQIVLSDLVTKNQHAFLKGWSILDYSVVANEVVHICPREGSKPSC